MAQPTAPFANTNSTALAGQTAIVTGALAPRGIGRAIALRLARDGANLAIADVKGAIELDGQKHEKLDLLEELAREISQGPTRAVAIELDVTQQAGVAACIAQTISAFGRIDILVNNAGSLAGSDAFLSTTPAQWQASFQVNLLGPMMMAQAVIPYMRAVGGGRIINIGSTGSLGAEAGFGAYTTMKHGLIGLSKTLAAEFGADGIRCNTVCPGYIATDMHEAANQRLAKEQDCSPEEIRARRYASVPLGAAGLPEDVANAVAYLAGPQARYVTGTSLPVTGGVPYGI